MAEQEVQTAAPTTEFDVQAAQHRVNEASARMASLHTQLAEDEIELNGEVKQEMSKLSAEIQQLTADLKNKVDEADYDKAVDEAYEIAPDKQHLETQGMVASRTVAKAIYAAMTGRENIRIAPAKRVDEDKFEVRNPKPRYESVDGKQTLVLQGEITAPEELAEKLFSPPQTRRNGFDLNPAQTEFSLLTSTTNSPIAVDYFNRILMQPLWSGKLHDAACSHVIPVSHTRDEIVYSFHARPATSVLTEGNDIAEVDVDMKQQTLHAYEVGSSTSLTKKMELAAADPNTIARLWDELSESLLDQWNVWLTTGTGISQPHGVYTAAQQAYQTANNKVYRDGGNNSNFVGTGTTRNNVNRIQTDGNATTKDGLLYAHQAYGKLSAKYRSSPKFHYQMNPEFAMHSLETASQQFQPTLLFPWVNFGMPAPMGVIYQGLGGPVYENPWLAKADTTDDNKMAVIGDFDQFWVRHSPIDMFVSDHVLAKQHKTYLRLTTFTDSMVPAWSPSPERVGPFVYIEAAGN